MITKRQRQARGRAKCLTTAKQPNVRPALDVETPTTTDTKNLHSPLTLGDLEDKEMTNLEIREKETPFVILKEEARWIVTGEALIRLRIASHVGLVEDEEEVEMEVHRVLGPAKTMALIGTEEATEIWKS